jgi:DnaK suppressor protein
MATKPKAKPETAKVAPEPAAKSTPKIINKSAPKNAVTTEPEVAKKNAAKTAPTPETKATSKTLKAKVTAKAEVPHTPKKDFDLSPQTVHKSVPISEVSKAKPLDASKIKKWDEIRVILEKIKEETLREITKSVKNGTDAVATNEAGGDIYDQASSERDRELGLLLGDREREKLHSIDEALLRIDEEEYGICEECDEDIPLGRLKAMPFTRHCVKCKSDLEKLLAQTKRFEEDRAYREIPLGSEEEEG